MTCSAKSFMPQIGQILRQYQVDSNTQTLKAAVTELAQVYGNYFGVGDILIFIGENYIVNGDPTAGIIFIQIVNDCISLVQNKTTLFLRMAEFHFEHQQEDLGVVFLTKLCTENVENYEESIAANGLTDIWMRYKHYVDGNVPPSVSFQTEASWEIPEESHINIDEIFAGPKEDLLYTLSQYLDKRTNGGKYLNHLNKWELTFYYIDELCMELNSGGFGHYLYYYGHHFDKVYRALELIGAEQTITLLEDVKTKFPKRRISRSLDRLQDILDKMEENGIEFEAEDDLYYKKVEHELLDKLLEFVMQHQKRFH